MTNLLLGIIIGILIRDIKCKTIEKYEVLKKSYENKGSAQFLEPRSFKEKFKDAKNLDDLLDNFNNTRNV